MSSRCNLTSKNPYLSFQLPSNNKQSLLKTAIPTKPSRHLLFSIKRSPLLSRILQTTMNWIKKLTNFWSPKSPMKKDKPTLFTMSFVFVRIASTKGTLTSLHILSLTWRWDQFISRILITTFPRTAKTIQVLNLRNNSIKTFLGKVSMRNRHRSTLKIKSPCKRSTTQRWTRVPNPRSWRQ